MAGDSWLSQIKDKFYGSDFYFQVTEHLEAKQAQISAGGDFHFQVTEYLETKQAQISAVTNQISTVASQVFSDLKTSLTVKFKSQRAPPRNASERDPASQIFRTHHANLQIWRYRSWRRNGRDSRCCR